MKAFNEIAINIREWFGIVAVWEYKNRKWKLVVLTRLVEARTLSCESQVEKLVFPTWVDPNRLRRVARSLPQKTASNTTEKKNFGFGKALTLLS